MEYLTQVIDLLVGGLERSVESVCTCMYLSLYVCMYACMCVRRDTDAQGRIIRGPHPSDRFTRGRAYMSISLYVCVCVCVETQMRKEE
jgi:hypothetical protein